MSRKYKLITLTVQIFVATMILAFAPEGGASNLNSNVSSVALTGTLLESLTVAATPSAVAFNLTAAGTAAGSSPVAVTTIWVLGAARTSVNVYGSFSSSTAALTDGAGHNIAAADVLGQVSTGLPTNFAAFTQTGPFGASGASLELLSQAITTSNLAGTRSDNLNLEIDLASLPQLPAGVYTGTLNIQAQAM